MNQEFTDAKGNIFVLPDYIGGEERYSSIYEDLVFEANTEFFMDYARENGKKFLKAEFKQDEDFSDSDIVYTRKYGGHEIYVKKCEENADLIEMIESLDYYPLLSEDKYAELETKYVEEFFEDGTIQSDLKEYLTNDEKDALDALEGICFADLVPNDTLFPKDHEMSANDILEFCVRQAGFSNEELLRNRPEEESLDAFHEEIGKVAAKCPPKQNDDFKPAM